MLTNFITRLALILTVFPLVSFSQINETDSKHELHYKYVPPIVTEDVKIEITNMHSQMFFTQIKMRITNNTNDFIALKTDDIIFTIAGNEYRPKDRVYLIGPRDYTVRTIRVDGDSRFHQDTISVKLSGFYKVPAEGNSVSAPSFMLPNNTNDFEMNGFSCKVAGKIIQETQLTELPLRCTYTGDMVGLIEASRVSVKLEDGKEFANINTGSKIKNLTTTGSTDVLFPGEQTKIIIMFRIPATTIDMQFANLNVQFNDAFSETKLVPLVLPIQELVRDNEKTNLKNK